MIAVCNSNRIYITGNSIAVFRAGTICESHSSCSSFSYICLDDDFLLTTLLKQLHFTVGNLNRTAVVVQLADNDYGVALTQFQTFSTVTVVGFENTLAASHLEGVLTVVVHLVLTFQTTIYTEYISRVVAGIERTSLFESLAYRGVNRVDNYGSTLQNNYIAVLDFRCIVVVDDFTGYGNFVTYVQSFVARQVAPITLNGLLRTLYIVDKERLLVDSGICTRRTDGTVGVGYIAGNGIHILSFTTALCRHSGSSFSTSSRNG